MPNEYVNHVVINGVTKVDLRSDTVTADKLAQGYTAHDASGAAIVGSYTPPTPTLQAKTHTVDSAGTATITADSGYDGLSSVAVSVPSADPWISYDTEYSTNGSNKRIWTLTPNVSVDVSQGDTAGFMADGYTKSAEEWYECYAVPANTTVTPTTSAQTIGGAGYMLEGAVTVAAMPSGAVSASATKGSVSNHAISVTPTATVGTAGYLAAGSTNGTAVSVSASELVSGNLAITQNGTGIDVTNYATVSVSVEGGSNDFIVTLSYNDSTETWEPDCTYAEAYAAVQAGKNVAVEAGDYYGASIVYDDEYGGFYYAVFEQFDEFNGTAYYNWGVRYPCYIWTADGIELDEDGIAYNTSIDTATPSDVAQGKYFHNASGIQVGTSSGGGSVTIKTTTMSNTSATATQIQFTSLTGQPKAFFCRCTSNLSRNSSNRYYYIADIRWDGSSTGGVTGNKYYVYNGQYSNQTTGYSKSYSNGTLTLTTTGSQTASPGSFYNGTYELVYVY